MLGHSLAADNSVAAPVTKGFELGISRSSKPAKSPVLVLVTDGKLVSVMADPALCEAVVINVPSVTTANAELCEQLLDACLPERFRQLNCPGNVIASGDAERLNAAEIQQRAARIELFDALLLGRPESERVEGWEAILRAMGGRLPS